jgi:hypothetical protein
MPFFYRRTDINDPRRGVNRVDSETKRTLDEPRGSAAEEGYVCLSRADRETGIRPTVGGEPDTFGRFVPD